MKRLLSLLVVAVIVCAACGSSKPSTTPVTPATGTLPPVTVAPSTTIAQAPTPPTTVIDTSKVPKHITIAYVTAVLKVLNHVYGDAVRSTVSSRRFTAVASSDLSQIYWRSELAKEQVAFLTETSSGLKNIRLFPGDPVTKVRSLLTATRRCIFAEVSTSYDAITKKPVAPQPSEYVGLKRRRAANAPSVGPTPWAIFVDKSFTRVTTERSECPNG